MPPKTTIAVLDIDEKGAVKAVDRTVDSMDRMGKKGDELARKVQEPTRHISRFTKAAEEFGSQAKRAESPLYTLTAKLFDLKGALIAVAGSIGLVFVLLQLGMILRDLVSRVLANNEAWKTFKTRLDDAFRSLAEGEQTVERVVRKMKELSTQTGAGVTSTFDILDRGLKLIEQRTETLHRLAQVMGGGAYSVLLEKDLDNIKIELAGVIIQLQDLGLSFTEIHSLLGRLGLPFELADKLRADAEKSKGGKGEAPVDLFGFAGIASPESFTKTMDTARASLAAMSMAFNMGLINAGQFGTGVDNLINKLTMLGATKEDIESLGLTMAESFEKGEQAALTLRDRLEQLAKTLDPTNLAFDVLVGLANQFASSISAGLQGAGITIKSFFADMLTMVGQTLLAWGALATTLGFFGLGPGVPVGLAAIAAGVAAIAAAQAIGVSNAAPPQGSQQAITGDVGGRVTPNVTIIVNGFHGDRHELAREVTQLVREGIADGVAIA